MEVDLEAALRAAAAPQAVGDPRRVNRLADIIHCYAG